MRFRSRAARPGARAAKAPQARPWLPRPAAVRAPSRADASPPRRTTQLASSRTRSSAATAAASPHEVSPRSRTRDPSPRSLPAGLTPESRLRAREIGVSARRLEVDCRMTDTGAQCRESREHSPPPPWPDVLVLHEVERIERADGRGCEFSLDGAGGRLASPGAPTSASRSSSASVASRSPPPVMGSPSHPAFTSSSRMPSSVVAVPSPLTAEDGA